MRHSKSNLTDKEIDIIINNYYKLRINNYIYADKNNIQSAFFSLINKLQKNIKLTEKEKKFFDDYQMYYYPKYIGNNLLYTKIEKKVLSPYKKLFQYYLKNFNNVNKASVYFMIYFLCSEMMDDLKINVNLSIVYDDKNFKDNNNLISYFKPNKKGNNNIYFNGNVIESKLSNYNEFLYFIICCYHELEHEVQEVLMNDEKIENAQALIWAKEKISLNYIRRNYYNENYHNVFFEKDAINYSILRMSKWFEDSSVFNNIKSQKYLEYDLNLKYNDPRNNNQVIAVDLMDIVAGEVISKKSELINKYPILKNIYNFDGSKKLYSEIESSLRKRMKNEILKYPKHTSEIIRKYNKLASEISKTDNELYIQKLCLDAYECEKEHKDKSLNQILNLLNKKTNERKIVFDDLMNRIDNRLNFLSKFVCNDAVLTEINRTKLLQECLLKYNQEFKQKYKELEEDNNIKVIIEKITKHSLDKYKLDTFSNKNKIVLMSKEELNKEEQEILSELEKSDLTKEDLKLYLEYVKNKYELFKSELEEDKPKRKIS